MRALVIGLMALGLTAGTTTAQTPRLVDGNWVMPQRGVQAQSEYYASGYEAAIYEAAAYYGISGDWLYATAMCESGLNPDAIGPNGERGIMQFHPNGQWPYAAWLGPVEQIWLAAQLFSQGYSYAWSCA